MKELHKEVIIEFQKIYRKVYREDITYDEAVRLATHLLHLYTVVYLDIDKFLQPGCQNKDPNLLKLNGRTNKTKGGPCQQ